MSKISDLARRGIYYQPLGATEAPVEEDGDFVRGAKKAMYQIPQTLGGSMALVGDAIGSDAMKDYGMEVYENQEAKIHKVTKDSDSLTNVLQGDESGVDWLQNASGYVAGQAVTAIATGGAGGFIGSQLAKRGIRDVVARGAESAMARQVAGKVSAAGAKKGAVAALFGSNLSQEAGSIYPQARRVAEEEGRELDGGDLGRVAGSAVAAAGVDTAMDALMIGKVMKGGRKQGETMLRAGMREVPLGMAREGITEGIQTGIERWGAREDMSTADAMRDYVDSVGVGMVGGGQGSAISVLRANKVPDSGPLTRAANRGIEEQILMLENDPDPLIGFPDGSVGQKRDFEAYLSQIADPEERLAKRREMMGRDPATGKRPEPVKVEDPTSAPDAATEKAQLKAWTDAHDAVDLDYAQALLTAPGTPKGMMLIEHPKGGGYTIAPSKWMTIDSQAKAGLLQKALKEEAKGEKGGKDKDIPVLNDAIAPADGIPVLDDKIAPEDGIPVLDDVMAPADGIPVLTDVVEAKNDALPAAGSVTETSGSDSVRDRSAVKEGSKADLPAPGQPGAVSENAKDRPADNAAAVHAGTAADAKPALNENDDTLYGQAVEIVNRTKKASIKEVQTGLKIGYNRAARLLEQMEAEGLVSAMKPNGERTLNEAAAPASQPEAAPEWKTNPYTAYKFSIEGGARAFMEKKQVDPAKFEPVQNKSGNWSIKPRAPTAAIEAAANEAATSPTNDLAQPTEGQKDAGNYRKGHVRLHGLDIAIENPAGSDRSGVDRSGKPWTNTLKHHYGYIKRTLGADGDHVDTFIGGNPESGKVFVVDQIDPETGAYDEHKVILGADSLAQARAIYAANYAKGWKGGKNVTETSVEGFKAWLKDGDTTKPFAPASETKPAKSETKQPKSETKGAKSGKTDAVPASGNANVASAEEGNGKQQDSGAAAAASAAEPVSKRDVPDQPASAEKVAGPATPQDVLREAGKLSNDLFGGNHPSVIDVGTADGTFAGSGTLNMDADGNVVLQRVADHESHLTKNWESVGVQELMDTSLSHGGGRGLPTSGFKDWAKSFGTTRQGTVLGTFRIPHAEFLAMIKRGDAVLGNIGEGEVVLNPAAAKQYLTEIDGKKVAPAAAPAPAKDGKKDWQAKAAAKEAKLAEQLAVANANAAARAAIPKNPQELAQKFIDAAPEDATNADEYEWVFRDLTKQELQDTGLLENFDEHAKNIDLDPEKSDLSRPVVVSMGDGERNPVAVWDGVHRIMSALARGKTVRAAVGTRRATDDQADNKPVLPVDNVIPSGNETAADDQDTGADIPRAFFKKVKVSTDVWIEEENTFEAVEMPADKALKSVREDIANYQALLKCMKG